MKDMSVLEKAIRDRAWLEAHGNAHKAVREALNNIKIRNPGATVSTTFNLDKVSRALDEALLQQRSKIEEHAVHMFFDTYQKILVEFPDIVGDS